MAVRPRLLVSSLAVAVAVGVVGGWALSRTSWFADDGVPDDVVLDTPGEYQQPVEDANGIELGAVLPSAVLTAVDGAPVDAASLATGPTVVNLWYSTCPPCEREMEDFAAVHGEVGDRVRFVGVNPIDTADVMVRFASDRGVDYELFRDPDGELVDALGVVSFPATLFVDADGRIVGEYGVLDADELRLHLRHHFGEVV